MEPSAAGLRAIESSEGFSSRPYLDRIASPPVWTQGFGETDNIRSNSAPISRAEGERRLKARFMRQYAWALKPFEKLPGFNQNRYDALASFIWNCGTGAVSKSTKVGRLLRSRNWSAAASALLEWSNAGGRRIPGLYARRLREKAMFLRGAVTEKLRPIKLGPKVKFHVDRLRAERRSADRHGGVAKLDPSHQHNAEVSKAWLREHATAYSMARVKDKPYQARMVDYLRDVALDRDGRGR